MKLYFDKKVFTIEFWANVHSQNIGLMCV
jgi:hypothetical protein